MFRSHFFIIVLSIVAGSFAYSENENTSSTDNESANTDLGEITPLSRNEGYMLLDLDVDGVAPSIHVIRTNGKELSIPLKDEKKGPLLMLLQEGKYQITRVNAPFYDLPYRLDTSTNSSWSFRIEAGKVNYVGKLIIEKKRGVNIINVNILNRIATDLDALVAPYRDLVSQHPLVVGIGVRDDFFAELNGE